jgi:hypothetical protein
MTKYIVWIRQGGKWVEQGEGEMTQKQAERIAREIRRDCGCGARALAVGIGESLGYGGGE